MYDSGQDMEAATAATVLHILSTIVHAALLLVAQYCISLTHLLELLLMVFFLHFCRPRMSVRVVNHSALPLRLLQFQFGLLKKMPVLLVAPVAPVHLLIISD